MAYLFALHPGVTQASELNRKHINSITTARRLRHSLAAILLQTTCLAATSYAQSPQGGVEEIIVTAQKREERLLDVPITISVVNPELLKSTNARNLAELQGALPSVYFAGNSGGGRTYVTMRGATGLALNTGDEPVAIYMDDQYLARGVTIGMTDFLDIAAIEVVRGPQGTLQGRNATAGAILFRSADPTKEPSGYLSVSAADPQEFRAQGAISGPLSDVVAARLAVGYNNQRGWGFNTVTNRHVAGAQGSQFRGIITIEPDNGFRARFVADYNDIRNRPALVRWAASTFSTLPTGALVTRATPDIPLTQAEQDRIKEDKIFSLFPDTSTHVTTAGGVARMSYALDTMEIVSITGYRKADVRGINNSGGIGNTVRVGYNQNSEKSNQWSEELRLQSLGDAPFSWILGLYGYQENQFYKDTIYNLRLSIASDTATLYTGNLDTSSFAAFADGTYKVSDQVSLIGGIRYTYDQRRINGRIVASNLTTGAAPTTTIYNPNPAHWNDVSYRAKLVYNPTDDVMLFAGYGRGFRAGGFNPFSVQPPYSPEINKSAEIGMKGEFLERRLTATLSGYRNLYQNLQLRAGVPTGGAIITNAANSRITGAELELTARPTDLTRISANTAYTDAIFTSFPRARDIFDREVDASGNKLPRSPKWQYFISAAQDFPMPGGSKITAEANYRWRGRVQFYFTNQDLPTWQDKPGDELGAQISWQDEMEHWRIAVFGTNLTDSRIINTAAVTFSYPEVGFNKPRVFGISVDYRY